MNSEYKKEAEKTWDLIAKSFDKTRRKPWDQCTCFIDNLDENYTVIDLCCGNGRHLLPCSEKFKKVIGLDLSCELLSIVKDKIDENFINNTSLIHSDVVNIPLRDNSVESVLYIAALHNIKGNENRIKSLLEVKRILKNEGLALISVWSRSQDKYRNIFISKSSDRNPNGEFGDIEIYWRQNGLNIPRFYHLYDEKEFKKDIIDSGLKIIKFEEVFLKSEKFPDNFFATVKK